MTPPPITTARARSGITGRVHQILDIRSSPNELIAIRLAFWIGTANALLWAPVHGARNIPLFRAWEPVSDALFGAFAQWDSFWFLHVAQHGYDAKEQSVFFPVYPLLVHAVAWPVRSTLVAGVLVSL